MSNPEVQGIVFLVGFIILHLSGCSIMVYDFRRIFVESMLTCLVAQYLGM